MDSTERSLVDRLQSGDFETTVKALSVLATEKERVFDDVVIRAALPLVDSEFEYIREYTIFALGLHLAAEEAFETILGIAADPNRELEQRIVSARSLGSYEHLGLKYTLPSARVLLSMFEDLDLDPELRDVAYCSLIRLVKGPIECSRLRLPDNIHEINIDQEFLKQCRVACLGTAPPTPARD